MTDETKRATCRFRWDMGETRCALPEGHGPLPGGAKHANAHAVEADRLRASAASLRGALRAFLDFLDMEGWRTNDDGRRKILAAARRALAEDHGGGGR